MDSHVLSYPNISCDTKCVIPPSFRRSCEQTNDPLAVLRVQLGTLSASCCTVALSVFKSRLKTHLFNTAYS